MSQMIVRICISHSVTLNTSLQPTSGRVAAFPRLSLALGIQMGHYTEQIMLNAERINQLKARIDETLKFRDKNEHKHREWLKACSDFHNQYEALAFPGGFNGALKRLSEGDQVTMEAAICFLECRPYFFRSGYMFKDILRKAKRAPLSSEQRERFDCIVEAYREYRKNMNV